MICDMHCDTISVLLRKEMENKDSNLRSNNTMIDLNKMKGGNYLLQTFAMFIFLKAFDHPYDAVCDMIDKYYREIDSNSDLIKPVYSYDDIIKNHENGLMSSLLSIEEGGVLMGKLSNLRNLYRLGVRMLTLTWNFENEIGYPNNFKKDNSTIGSSKIDSKVPNTEYGLKPFGIEVVKEMEKLGMIIDVSHLSDKGFYDVYENTTKPFVASHSNSRTVCSHVRNMTDDMILKLASRGGVMGINYCDRFINNDEPYTVYVKDLVKHINYIRDLAGIDCIGLGSDFDGINKNHEMDDASKLHLLKEELIKEGYSESDIEKIFYKNVLRVFKECLK